MNLIEKIDILIDAVYNQKIRNQSISNIFESKGIDYDYDSSHVICEKVDELGIFRTINSSSSSGADFILNPNPTGLDFVNEFHTYSNFLHQQKIEQEFEQSKIKEKELRELEAHKANLKSSEATVSAADSAKTSKNWAIITGIVGIFSFAWAIYQTILTTNLNDVVESHKTKLKQQDSIIEIQHQRLTNFERLLNQKQLKK